jgi:cell division protein FtsW (lipid II flippase)
MHAAIHSRLLRWAEIFLFIYSLVLTISPSVRERGFDVDYRWLHWIGFAVWLILVEFAEQAAATQLPDRDPYLFPAAALLSGWGMLTIWRMDQVFGLRQLLWFSISISAFLMGLRLPSDLQFLRRYKYVLLSGGLLLTSLTLLFGTNPGGFGPALWLGCCGVYFQPSEPLKLLLVIYLAAYLADKLPVRLRVFPLLLPTVFVTGLALLLLVVQRDLGTASIFILIYTVILFLATGYRRVLVSAFIGLALAGLVGYSFISVIRVRVDAWLNPWLDPSGRSYQIIQSLLAVANGGTIGRGPGLGSPTLVPVSISDFIFSAIAEESGLLGVVGLLTIFGLIVTRGIVAALRAPDQFRRLLAAGATAYLGIQSLLIVGGNIRLLPLTGVTLPFVSYGGSSLLTSFIALFLLLQVGGNPEQEPAPLPTARPYLLLSSIIGIGLIAALLGTTWWGIIRGPDLLTRTDNPRRSIADRYVKRGDLVDQQGEAINITVGETGSLQREYLYPDLSPVVGYTHPVYGQAGLEASLDEYLRGLQGNPASTIWWDHLLYGTPPPGLDVRLSLQLPRQVEADQMMGAHPGAAILINAHSGEILVMASHPTFDAGGLDAIGSELATDPDAPLINRAVQGSYAIGTASTPFIEALSSDTPPYPAELKELYQRLGFFSSPQIRLPVAETIEPPDLMDTRVSPLQLVIAAAALSNEGVLPAPRIALAVNTPQQGWVILPALGESTQALDRSGSEEAARSFLVRGESYWEYTGQASQDGSIITWYLGGTLPDWQGTPLAVVVALEEDNTYLARLIGESLLAGSLSE